MKPKMHTQPQLAKAHAHAAAYISLMRIKFAQSVGVSCAVSAGTQTQLQAQSIEQVNKGVAVSNCIAEKNISMYVMAWLH